MIEYAVDEVSDAAYTERLEKARNILSATLEHASPDMPESDAEFDEMVEREQAKAEELEKEAQLLLWDEGYPEIGVWAWSNGANVVIRLGKGTPMA